MAIKNIFLFFISLGLAGCMSHRVGEGLKNGTDDSKFKKISLVGPQSDATYIVPTSQIIEPAGKTVTFPGRPFDLALSPDETILAVKNMTDLVFMDVSSQTIIQTLKLPNRGNSFKGIGWSADGKKVWVTDESGNLRSAKVDTKGEFAWSDAIALPGNDKKGPYPGGFAIDEGRGLIYVVLNRTNKLGVVDIASGKLLGQIPVGVAPYTVLLKGNKAYVSNWGGRHPGANDLSAPSSGTPVVIDKNNGVLASGTVSVVDLIQCKSVNEISVGLHPSGMAFSPDKSMLYVANANSDNVSVIDTKTDKVVKTISSKPMEELPFGSAPNDVAVSPDGKTLYIADGGDNLLAVVDLQKSKLTGLIPTGWYPSAVAMTKDGSKIIVANLKGIGSWAPSKKSADRDMNVTSAMLGKGHNTHDQMGSVSFIDVPAADSLQKLTIKAAANMRLPKINQELNLAGVQERLVPVPTRPGEKSPIKHILYIIKENRTYDQILGDMPQGNGDSSLCMFGRYITPNHHKLAEEFVLLDNTYCNGVKSVEGHQWTSQGYVTDYLEKGFPSFVRGYPWNGGDPLVYAGSGFIWDYVLKAGLSFRDYGEYVSEDITPAKFTWTDVYNDIINGTDNVKIRAVPTVHTLKGNFCPNYTGGPREINDQYKANVFIKELQEFEKSGSMPNLMMMSLPNDHTSGTQEGFPVPNSMVADNDLALGRIVAVVSHSRFWKETAIFVIEDDPQFGLDHVDGHRTIAYCISPYTKRKAVVSTHYNQNSILRTIQLILGLPPMSQFDLIAMPMTDCFMDTPDLTPYKHLSNNVPLNIMNPKLSSLKGKELYWAKQSMKMNLQENDDLDHEEEIALNKVLWHSAKGYGVPYPKSAKK